MHDEIDAVEQRSAKTAPQAQLAAIVLLAAAARARVSATRRVPPLRSTQRATERPVSPRPSTSTRLPASAIAGRARKKRGSGLAHHLSLSVESPNSTSIMVMIQKRTTTWLSFQPSSS